MDMRTSNKLAHRLMGYCRTRMPKGSRHQYQWQRRTIFGANGEDREQVLFADGFTFIDVTAYIGALRGDVIEDASHWHDDSALDVRAVNLAKAWDEWEAVSADGVSEELDPLNTYTYIGDVLAQVFAVVGSGDGQSARRVLVDTALLQLLITRENWRDAVLDGYYTFAIAADSKVAVRDEYGMLCGFVMPIASNHEQRAQGHTGQGRACPTCGGDGEYRPAPMAEAVTA